MEEYDIVIKRKEIKIKRNEKLWLSFNRIFLLSIKKGSSFI